MRLLRDDVFNVSCITRCFIFPFRVEKGGQQGIVQWRWALLFPPVFMQREKKSWRMKSVGRRALLSFVYIFCFSVFPFFLDRHGLGRREFLSSLFGFLLHFPSLLAKGKANGDETQLF